MEFLTQLFSQKAVVFDLALTLIILIFAVLGARRGMVLSLCSLAAVILALIGGTAVSNYLTPPLAQQFAPMLEGLLQEPLNDLLLSGTAALEKADGFLPHVVLNVLESQNWTSHTVLLPPEFILAVTQAVLRPIIFLLAFVLVLIIWHFISHALDLVARLPVLSAVNALGGFLIGIIKGVLVLIVLYLAVRTFRPGLIPEEILTGSRILGILQKAPAFF